MALTPTEIDRLMLFVNETLKENADLFDFLSEIDNSLNFYENKNILADKMELFKNKTFKSQLDDYKETETRYTNMVQDSLNLSDVLKKHDIIGITGNRNTGKSMLSLTHLEALKIAFPKLSIVTLGVEESLKNELKRANITILESTMDILDLNISNSIIYIDEFALLFSTKKQDKEQDKLMRFFDRISHQNCKLIINTAREGFYNKFMCSRITAFLVKQVEYEALVNGSWLKERVKAINSNSDYRLECAKEHYYLVSPDSITQKYNFKYNPKYDSKKSNINLFGDD